MVLGTGLPPCTPINAEVPNVLSGALSEFDRADRFWLRTEKEAGRLRRSLPAYFSNVVDLAEMSAAINAP